MDSNLYLNRDLLFEILTQTTLETMDTCKVVSRELRELVNNPWFLQNYCRRTKYIIGYLVQTIHRNRALSTFVSIDPTSSVPKISIQSFGENSKILASSNQGILCCRTYKNRSYEYYVCKPSTKQHVVLPSPTRPGEMFEHVALVVLKSNPLHYKIIRFISNIGRSGDNYICEIFNSERKTWRKSKDLVLQNNTIFGHQPSVSIGRMVYWLTNNNTILEFDSVNETYTHHLVPTYRYQEEGSYKKKRIIDYNGKLGFTCEYKSQKLLVWEMTNHKWEIKKVVKIDNDENKLIGCGLADMGLMTGYMSQIYQQSDLHYPMEIFPFRSDWKLVNLE